MLPMRMAIAERAKRNAAASSTRIDSDREMKAYELGTAIGLLDCTFDNIAKAQKLLRDGNVSGAQMFLDMCRDPRKETA